MNMQAMLKQAQKLQKDMLDAKAKIDEKKYEGKSGFVTVEVFGNKNISQIKVDKESLDKDDVEALSDMLVVALNDAMKKIDSDTESSLGKYTKGMPGLF